jgi:translocation and assembly module TamB
LGRGHLNGRFRAGDGTGSLDGHISFEDVDQIQVDIALSGDQLLLVNTDDLKIHTDTDITIGFGPQRTDINGVIRIPNAHLTPANLLVEKVNDSEDLVIENAGSGSAPKPAKPASGNQVFGQLEVTFGKNVMIAVPDVKTKISGTTLFYWSGDPVPLAEGVYVLKGKVDMYGPTLLINNGTISFPKVPADNPLLNIRAEREIFGNIQIRSAGVRVIGTLKRPKLEAYTVPVTNEDRAWTLLITGSDFDQGQGVGGFDVGTYIAPRLYVSYGISLFDNENVISARYDLKKGFGVKVTSGHRETGLDVSYTIDR